MRRGATQHKIRLELAFLRLLISGGGNYLNRINGDLDFGRDWRTRTGYGTCTSFIAPSTEIARVSMVVRLMLIMVLKRSLVKTLFPKYHEWLFNPTNSVGRIGCYNARIIGRKRLIVAGAIDIQSTGG